MAYEIYKEIKSKQQYFNTWDSQNYAGLSGELQTELYNKYVVKCTVFQRDNFVCQNPELKEYCEEHNDGKHWSLFISREKVVFSRGTSQETPSSSHSR